ncbi:4-hydroxy-tetrahydrodipicolinate synthase [Wenzhouxiangella marina]|uniref:4-hydroxy-tetrahydrodipicolinate synthase n=1 Tax=Wenzhouxiangella marina TaxID=1579979 RepID=A0A0K0XUD2_9GAMM|nr:4-hydroxy-tetrahydrodipicolinate synthase [Wenzhouxiangella marina]AKS41293.1 4-hydroxy-tetrahydrodipicolinate synthase [Wenzhouxiangella marina]MBB6086957.1 4-hydroxy-tetrahydrodipicolinate synthase [Wenzhouxiangella marina]
MFSGSIVALVTPFKTDGSLDESAWIGLLDWHLASGTDGVVVVGTTGESATVSNEEFERLLALAVERVGGRMAILAGTGSSSTQQTIERTARAAALGADAALVVTPAYNRPTQRGLEAHYRAVADAASIPVVLYNVPARTACDLLPETVARLADHERIVAIKEAVGDADRVAALVETGLTVLSGDDPTCCERMLAGAKGVISVAANVVPARFARLCHLALDGDADGARTIDRALAELYSFLGVEPNPVPVKWLLHRMGRLEDALRLPLVSLDARHRAAADALIRAQQLDVVSDVA